MDGCVKACCRLGWAIALVAAGMAARAVAAHYFGADLPYALFYLIVAAATLMGGIRLGLVATVLVSAAAQAESQFDFFHLGRALTWSYHGGLLAADLLVVWLCGSLQVARC